MPQSLPPSGQMAGRTAGQHRSPPVIAVAVDRTALTPPVAGPGVSQVLQEMAVTIAAVLAVALAVNLLLKVLGYDVAPV